MRKQVTCRCRAYDFPHRFGGGRCNGIAIVEQHFPGSLCGSCLLFNDGCEVLKGQESPCECMYVQDFIEYQEIKL
ncbi:hypothetical protein [Escherichia phage SRT8]|uniref:Uncharacterized protein n=1 Tax=Escherichia phage SRT8 TaxID=2496545 RepID=A0A2D1GPA4_9CAUD|nr:hypothetical protein FDI72_gp63 [Escherichia phage SRT8]ATN93840.1 hypothetical protein [Escherichia phage SRT8]